MFSCQRLNTSVAQFLQKLKEVRGGAMLFDKQKHHNSEMTSGQSDPITPCRVKETSCGTGDHVEGTRDQPLLSALGRNYCF